MNNSLNHPTALAICELTKSYPKVKAVDQVSFEVRPGEIYGLLGPNGAGKTSIISVIVTLEEATAGRAKVFGVDVQENPRLAKQNVGWVPQEIINHGFFSVEEVLQFISGFFGRRHNQSRIDFLLNRLGLWEHRQKRVKELSGGMKRRLMIAKALVHEPRLLLLDEPTAGVDIELRSSLWQFCDDLRKEGVAILLTTHYLEEAEHLCDRVGIIHKGRLLREGPTKELVSNLTQRKVRLMMNQALSPVKHSLLIAQSNDHLEFQLPSKMGVGELLNELKFDTRLVRDIQIQEGDLEDAFRSVLGGAL